MPYQVSPIQLALRDTSNILGEGLSSLGQQKIRAEELGLKRALQERQLTRESEQDARAKEEYALRKPAIQNASEQAKIKQQQWENPVTLGTLTGGDDLGLGHWTSVSKADPSGLTMVEKFGNLVGAKYDTSPDSPTRGQFLKADGTPLKNRDMEPKWKEITELIASNTDPDHLVSDQFVRYQRKIDFLKSQGVKDNDPKMKEAITMSDRAKALLEDPEKRLKMYQKHRDALSKFQNDDAKREVALLDQKISKAETQMFELKKATANKEADLSKMLYQESRKDARAKLSADTRLKAADKVASGKGVKLSPQDAAEVALLKSEYNSNLKVIEAYRKGEDIKPAAAAAARRNNVDIAKKIKKLGIPKEDLENQNLDPLGLFSDEEDEE